MLYDPKWNEGNIRTAVRNFLLQCADRIEREGWRQNSQGPGRCPIEASVGIDEEVWPYACEELKAYLLRSLGDDSIIQWNDTPGRTKDQVLFALRDCAEKL